jgi:hypothetical protein
MVAVTLGLVLLSAAPLQGVHAAAGDLDPGFGAGGKTMLDFAGVSEESYAMAIQPDGKIILAGFTISGDTQHVAVVRLDGHGNLDPTFAVGGKGTIRVVGCKIFLDGVARDQSISALSNVCTHVGAASMNVSSLSKPMTIADSNMTNNTCGCK